MYGLITIFTQFQFATLRNFNAYLLSTVNTLYEIMYIYVQLYSPIGEQT